MCSMKESLSDTTVLGTPFALDALDDSADNGARVGLFIILEQRVTVDVLERLLRLTTQDAIVVTIAGDTEFKTVLETRGFTRRCLCGNLPRRLQSEAGSSLVVGSRSRNYRM